MGSSNAETRTAQVAGNKSLSISYILCLLLALLMTAASVLGLLQPDEVYPTEDLRQSFFTNDVVNLVIGLPTILGAAWLSWRGKLVGLLFLPGAILFILYNYIAYAFSMPVNWMYVLYMSIVALSAYLLIALVAGIDVEAVKDHLAGAVKEKLSAAVVILLGGFNFLRVFIVIANVVADPSSVNAMDLSVLPSDFLISPAWIIGGVLLWQRKSLGYAAGLGLLFQASMLFVGLIVFMVLQPVLTDVAFDPVDVIVVLIMGLICFIPFGMYIRGVARNQGAEANLD